MADFRDLSRTLRRSAQRTIPMSVDQYVQKLATEIVTSVVKDTPIDIGVAKSNWQLGIDTVPSDVLEAYAPGKAGSTASANESAAIDKATSVIGQYKGDRTINIVNNAPHISRLNDGYSNQAPANFVEKAVIKGESVLQRANIVIVE